MANRTERDVPKYLEPRPTMCTIRCVCGHPIRTLSQHALVEAFSDHVCFTNCPLPAPKEP